MKCTKCGTEYEGNFCPSCGTSRDENGGVADEKKGKKWYLSLPFIIAMFLIFPLIGIVLLVIRLIQMKRYDKKYNQRTIICTIALAVCFIGMVALIGASMSENTDGENQHSANAESEKSEEPTTAEPATAESAMTEKEIYGWIEDNEEWIKDFGAFPSDKEIEKMRKADQEVFDIAWKRYFTETYQEVCVEYGNDYSVLFSSPLRKLVELYTKIWGENTSSFPELFQLVDQLSSDISSRSDLEDESYELAGKEVCQGEFYVMKELGWEYDDNLVLGTLKDLLTSITGKSEWLSYGIDYTWGQALPDEDKVYVILSENENPFQKQGAYNLSYIDSGETVELVDEFGFESEAPLYILLEEGTNTYNWIEEYQSLTGDILYCQMKIDVELGLMSGEEDEEEGEDVYDAGIDDGPSFLLQYGDSKVYTEDELQWLIEEPEYIRACINEIYARHGYIFKSEEWNDYFSAQDWYYGTTPADQFDDSVLNDYEKANLDLLLQMEAKYAN